MRVSRLTRSLISVSLCMAGESKRSIADKQGTQPESTQLRGSCSVQDITLDGLFMLSNDPMMGRMSYLYRGVAYAVAVHERAVRGPDRRTIGELHATLAGSIQPPGD